MLACGKRENRACWSDWGNHVSQSWKGLQALGPNIRYCLSSTFYPQSIPFWYWKCQLDWRKSYSTIMSGIRSNFSATAVSPAYKSLVPPTRIEGLIQNTHTIAKSVNMRFIQMHISSTYSLVGTISISISKCTISSTWGRDTVRHSPTHIGGNLSLQHMHIRDT